MCSTGAAKSSRPEATSFIAAPSTPALCELAMLDFLFRRGNPTNNWRRSSGLSLTAELAIPALNGVALGSPFDQLSSLGRNDDTQYGTLCYYDLGIGVDCAQDGAIHGYTVVLADENDKFQPFCGTLRWNDGQIGKVELRQDRLQSMFGEWYWLDEDEDELIAFFEYPSHEMQVEISQCGAAKRIILIRDRLMSKPDQRESYGVNKAWPPQCHHT